MMSTNNGQTVLENSHISIQNDIGNIVNSPLDGPEASLDMTLEKKPKPSSASSSSSSSFHPASVTSTIAHQQTPFAEFEIQVRQLCHSLWPPTVKEHRTERLLDTPNSRLLGRLRTKTFVRFLRQTSPPKECDIETSLPINFIIERMSGGTYNRIVGISIPGSEGRDPTRLVLRTPRMAWNARPDREVATLNYIRQHTIIPVPDIKAFDLTDENPVKSPFVVQSRVPGIDLATAISNGLSHKQWCKLAIEVGRIIIELQKVTSPTPGLVEAATREDRVQTFKTIPFDIKNPHDMEYQKRQANSSTLEDENAEVLHWYEEDTLNFFATQFGRWKAEELRRDPTTILWRDQMQRLTDVASAMNRLGIFRGNENCLAHLDLAPRNIMVELETDESIRITGILDWDSAVFAPKFVSCRPPWWLWQDEKYPVDPMLDDTNADDELDDPELLEIKNLFEDTMGDSWYRCAYRTPFRLARRLFNIAIHGNNSNEMFSEIDDVLAEWAAYYKSEVEDYVSEDENQTAGSSAVGTGNTDAEN